jgi:pyruvate formate lyase activating enzyme
MKSSKEPPMEKQISKEGIIFKIKRFSIHDGPGIRTAVFMKGCPLNCVWCHSPEGISPHVSIWYNPNICISCGLCVKVCPANALKLTIVQDSKIEIDHKSCRLSGECIKKCPTNALQFTGSVASVSTVMEEIEKDIPFYRNSGGGITLTGGEPLFQPDFSTELLKACRAINIHTTIETSLFLEKSTLNRLSEFVDLFIVDLKIFDPELHRINTGKSNKIIMENFISLAGSGKEIIVRVPLIKDITDTKENRVSLINFVHCLNIDIPIEFIKSNALAGNNYRRLGMQYLLK